MATDPERVYTRGVCALLAGQALIWLTVGMLLDLHPDEADHWVWSRYLSWGYYEHPPLVAWAIRFFCSLLGNNQWALEIGSQTFTLLTLTMVFRLARSQFGAPAGFWAVLLLLAAPLYSAGSLIFIIDTPLLFFYCWAAAEFWSALQQKNNGAFYRAGLALGLALLSKFTAVLFPAAALVFLISSRQRRSFLRNPHLWAGLLLALVLFAPFLYWNASNNWISLGAQLEKGLSGGRPGLQALTFWFGQPLVLGPVLCGLLVLALVRAFRPGWPDDDRRAYLIVLTAVPLLVFGLAAFKGRYTDPTWSDIAWPFGAVWAGHWLTQVLPAWTRRRKLLVGGLVFLTGWLPLGLVAVHAVFPFLPVQTEQDRTLEMAGWRQLGQALGREYNRFFPGRPRVYVLTDEYQLAGAISFYTPQHPLPYTFAKSQRNIWTALPDLRREGALLVCRPGDCRGDLEKTRALFPRVAKIREIAITRREKVVKIFEVYYCRD